MSNFSVINLQKELSFTMGMNRGHIKSMGKKNLRIWMKAFFCNGYKSKNLLKVKTDADKTWHSKLF